jgi:glucose-6-phosphate 1-dehydrogenase
MSDPESAARATTIVVFGASGDLTARKLIPSLLSLYRKRRLPGRFNVVGFSRTDYSHDAFRQHLREGAQQLAAELFDAGAWGGFAERIWYSRGDSEVAADYQRLDQFAGQLENGPANRLYYLATVPELFPVVAANLGAQGLTQERDGWRRIVVEKPFGEDLTSAQALNRALHAVFDERQIFRMDHYLGKETAQNILFFRFGNLIFEPIWNRNYVDNVQISALEDIDVGHRAGYYDHAGVFRDMFQNHLLQLLCLVAMEPPASFGAEEVRNEKIKVLSAIPPIDLADVVRGQYDGYCETEGVAADSRTPTYGAAKLSVDNWRWHGVPFYLRSGKALASKTTEIVVEFHCPPHWMFGLEPFTPNLLSLAIQPDEGIRLKFQAKVPEKPMETRPVDLAFQYRTYFCCEPLPDAYEPLLLDVLGGDASLFPRRDAIEAAWRLMDPVIAGLEQPGAPPLVTYQRGSQGPAEADELLAFDGRCWRFGGDVHPQGRE